MNLHTNLDLTHKKVAETAEIHKTAPQNSPKSYFHDSIKQMETISSTFKDK